jgi:hypothetical protein
MVAAAEIFVAEASKCRRTRLVFARAFKEGQSGDALLTVGARLLKRGKARRFAYRLRAPLKRGKSGDALLTVCARL